MLIDWFTVAAQIANFLILVVLLKYLLYDRIVRAMDQREERIQSRMTSATEKQNEAESEAENYRRKQKELESERDRIISRAKEEAEQRREEMVQQARDEVESLRTRWRETLQRNKDTFLRDLMQMAGKEVYNVSRRALKDLGDADLEERIVDSFIQRLRNLDEKEQKEISDAVDAGDRRVAVQTAFEASSGMKRKVTAAVHDTLGEDVQVAYEARPQMILGIEIKSRGQKIAWSLEDYLETLEQETMASFQQEAQGAAPKVEAAQKEPTPAADEDVRAPAERETRTSK